MEYKKAIRDPVHGFIKLTAEEVELIDGEPLIQRLRYVKQLGFVYLVYPTATHTRFDHTLGVMHIATLIGDRVLRQMGAYDEELIQHLRVAALLHDIGHMPFSHTFEPLARHVLFYAVERRCVNVDDLAEFEVAKKPHEITTRLLVDKLAPRLAKLGYDPELVKDLLFKRRKELRPLSNIISGTFDADRLDYIMRDIYFTGAAVGTSFTYTDLQRIVENLWVGEEGFYFDEKARVNLEGYLLTRYNLYRHVYLHHKTVLFTELARKAFVESLEKCRQEDGSPICDYLCSLARFIAGQPDDEIWKATDDYFVAVFTHSQQFRELLSRKPPEYVALWKREKDFLEFFKDPQGARTAVATHWALLAKLWEDVIESLNRLMGNCQLTVNDVIITHVEFEPYSREREELYITTAIGRPVPLSQISPLVEALENAWKRSPQFFIFIRRDAVRRCNGIIDELRASLESLLHRALRRHLP